MNISCRFYGNMVKYNHSLKYRRKVLEDAVVRLSIDLK